MKIFVSQIDSLQNEKEQALSKFLRQMGVIIVEQQDTVAVDQINAVIININKKPQHWSHLVALSLSENKPILCLMKKGGKIPAGLKSIRKNESAKRLITIAEYTPQTMVAVVSQFLKKIEKSGWKEIPSIKFTLRITPSMEKYLQWKSERTQMSKADFLREVIVEQIIKKDRDYHVS